MNDLQEIKEKILQSTTMSALVAEKVQLTRRGNLYTGLCPFHEESSPSFTVYPDHYYCFGCKASGDAIRFVEKTNGLSFWESLKHLADKAGLSDQLARVAGRPSKDQGPGKERFYAALREAQSYFTQQLLAQGKDGEVVSYLRARKYSDSIISDLGFGWAPNQGLCSHLRSKGFKEEELLQTSLASPSHYGRGIYEFFRERMTIPIIDPQGRVIGFGARTLKTDVKEAKYKNSRETHLFQKSHVLFGMDRAKEAMRKRKRAIVAEGYMDVFRLWTMGFLESVGVMGTSLQSTHVRQLSAFCTTVYLVFDGDSAGEKASISSLKASLESEQTHFAVVRLPDKHDPDSFLQEYGSEALEELLNKAPALLDYILRSQLIEGDKGTMLHFLNQDLIPILAQLKDPLRRAFLIQKISLVTGISTDQLEKSARTQLQKEKARAAQQNAPHTAHANIKIETTEPLQPNSAPAGPISIEDQNLIRQEILKPGPFAEVFSQLVFGTHIPPELIDRILRDELDRWEISPPSRRLLELVLRTRPDDQERSLSDLSYEQLKSLFATRGLGHWPSAISEGFWRGFCARKDLYQPHMAKDNLLRLLDYIQQQRVKAAIQGLKRQLAVCGEDERNYLLSQIQDLMKSKQSST